MTTATDFGLPQPSQQPAREYLRQPTGRKRQRPPARRRWGGGRRAERLRPEEYGDAAESARDAYVAVLEAAAAINISVEPQAWQSDYGAKGKSGKFIDEAFGKSRQP
jgi:hypothetical protein